MPTLLLVARSAVASDFREPAFWRSCSLQAQRLLGVARVADLAQFAEAAAEVRFRDDELMYNVADAAVAELERLDTDTLAVVLRTHALLRFRNDRAVGQLQAELFRQMQQSRATASGLAAALLGLARLREAGLAAAPPRELLEAVGRMVTEHLNFFTQPQLSDVLESYARNRVRGDRQTSALFIGVGAVLAKGAQMLSAEQCASAVRAFAKCRVHDERLLAAIAHRLRDKEVRGGLRPAELAGTLYGLAKFSCQDTALMDLLSIEARRSLHLMGVPLISAVLASLAKAGVSALVLTNRAVTQLKRAQPEEIDAATNQELLALAMAFGKLQVRDEHLFKVFAESFLRRTSPLLAQEECGELVNIIHAFTKVHCVDAKLFGMIAMVLLDRFEELSLREIVKYLHGIAKVEYLPLPALQERILATLEADKLSTLGVFDLLKLAAASKRLGLRVPSLEQHMSIVLPNEAKGDAAGGSGPGRRPSKARAGGRRRQSARKRKWTW